MSDIIHGENPDFGVIRVIACWLGSWFCLVENVNFNYCLVNPHLYYSPFHFSRRFVELFTSKRFHVAVPKSVLYTFLTVHIITKLEASSITKRVLIAMYYAHCLLYTLPQSQYLIAHSQVSPKEEPWNDLHRISK